MKRTKRYDEGGGIPAQTEEEAANEMELNSPAARARRNVSDAENQIRADALAKLASKAAPAMEMDEAPTKMPMRPGQASSGMTKTPMVTKEQLAASGLSLRDYLNKQQRLTPRKNMASRNPSDLAESRSIRNAIAKSDMESGRATVQRQDAAKNSKVDLTSPMSALRSLMSNSSDRDVSDEKLDLTSPMSALRSSGMFKGTRRGGGDYAKGGTVKKMASGGSVSSASKRADGIAQRGKTKGKMC